MRQGKTAIRAEREEECQGCLTDIRVGEKVFEVSDERGLYYVHEECPVDHSESW